jgi:hypothetical protein
MADFCSTALGFGGITHGDSDDEPTTALAAGSMESAVVPRMTSVASPMGLATTKPSVVPTLVRNANHQDDVVAPQLASLVLPIGMAMVKPTVARR